MIRLTEEDLFVAYSLPGSQSYTLIVQNNHRLNPLLFTKSAFIVAPFMNSSDYPAFTIRADERYVDEPFVFTTKRRIFSKDISKEKYLVKIEKLKNRLQHIPDSKVILSRTKTIPAEGVIWSDTFCSLVQRESEAFVFLFNSPMNGAWMGASPELLLSQTKENFKTIALAGTRKKSDNQKSWNDKDLEEHKIVVDFITRKLEKLNSTYTSYGTNTVQAANVEHLQTSFDFKYKGTVRNLVKSLHPSPALLGWPEALAVSSIEQFEENDRGYYCGYLGPISPNEKQLFINLRSMRCASNRAVLYAGGGILANSVAESEWQETEMKMKVMESIISVHNPS